MFFHFFFFFFQAEDGIRDLTVTGVQTCALPISSDHSCQILRCAQNDSDADTDIAENSTGAPDRNARRPATLRGAAARSRYRCDGAPPGNRDRTGTPN